MAENAKGEMRRKHHLPEGSAIVISMCRLKDRRETETSYLVWGNGSSFCTVYYRAVCMMDLDHRVTYESVCVRSV